MTMSKKIQHKAVIETMINTAAIAITGTGTAQLIQKDYWGFILISFGVLLEFIKYVGRNKKLW